jgi:hypothetical protein
MFMERMSGTTDCELGEKMVDRERNKPVNTERQIDE